jgi:hypothetical protein
MLQFVNRDRRLLSRLAVQSALLILAFATGEGQQKVIVVDRPTCTQCAIELAPVATIGSRADSFSFVLEGGSFEQDSRGFLYIGPRIGSNEPGITVYDSRGKYVDVIGPRGAGPGELRYDPSKLLIVPGDTLYVFHNGAVNVFGPSRRFVRKIEFPLSSVSQAIVLRDGRMVISLFYRTPELIGIPVHVFDPTGKRIASFGPQRAVLPGPVDTRSSLLARSNVDSLVWIAGRSRYELQLWSTTGRHVRTLERQADWFKPWHGEIGDWRRHRQEPVISGVFQDSAGMLWVTLSVADADWRALPDSAPESAASDDMDRFFDTVIEVIDPRRGTVEARLRVDQYLPGLGGQGLVATMTEDSGAVPFLHIWRPILRRR